MVFSSKIEDQWASARRVSESERLKPQNSFSAEAKALSSDQIKVEWYLRRGASGAPLVLRDLRNISDAKILDSALWGVLQESTQSTFFSSQISWSQLRGILGSFIRSHPLEKALLVQAHSGWWRWMVGIQPGDGDDADLKALAVLERARVERHPIQKMEGYAISYSLLANSGNGFESSQVADEYVQDLSRQKDTLRRSGRDYFQKVQAEAQEKTIIAGRFFTAISSRLIGVGKFAESAEFRAYDSLLKLGRKEPISAKEFVEIANGVYQAGQWEKAYQYFSLSLGAAGFQDLDLDEQLGVELRRFISATNAKTSTQISMNDFEVLVDKTFNSVYRDEALLSFARYLERENLRFEAKQAWSWVRSYSYNQDQRFEAIDRLIDYQVKDVVGLPKSSSALASLVTATELSSSYAVDRRFLPKLKVLLSAIKDKSSKFNLNQNKVLRASLSDFEKRIARLR